MRRRPNIALCAAILAGLTVFTLSHAQIRDGASAPGDTIERIGTVEQVDSANRRIVINGLAYQIPALVPVTEPPGQVHYDLQQLQPGMHIRFTTELPSEPTDAGAIKAIRIVPD